MADEKVLERLREIARKEGISLGAAIRQGLDLRARQGAPRFKFIGAGEAKSGPRDMARRSGDLRFEPPSWR
jgi:hypothetical protein